MATHPLLELEHVPPRKLLHKKILSAYDFAKVGFFLFGMPRNAFGSIDVTKECNLRCAHCYFYEGTEGEAPAYAGKEDLTDDQWIARLEELKSTKSMLEFPFFQCTWVGGEPLVRKGLIEKARKYFRYNTIVTNGTIPLPSWPDVHWYISCDGDEETHERIRRKKGIYKRAMKHVAERPELTVTIAYCITKENAHCIERAVKDWAAAGAARITFDFFTPVADMCDDNDGLFLPLHDRDAVLDKLMALKDIYGDFFVIPKRVFRLMKSDVSKRVTDNCMFESHGFALGADGIAKEKCMMGPEADCDRCGCVVPFYMASLTDRRLVMDDVRGELAIAAKRAANGVFTAIGDLTGA
jgi:MoaA/NifB/PqqE/SkfB family radical SAM enzyme